MTQKPNILFILVDQTRMPPPQSNLTSQVAQINQVLSFDPSLEADNPFIKFFPAFERLRRHSVRLANHQIAAAACVPSRSALFTGQYSVRTGVTQTVGIFKQSYDPGFPWLPNNQVSTVGDWFRAAGYSTHFFGRHDFTTPPAPSLEEWGFSNWSQSWPSSQGGGPGNLGVFRDIGFVDVTNTWMNQKALGYETNVRNIHNSTNATTAQTPWFAVASFVNPHDITGWPLPWFGGIQAVNGLPESATQDEVFKAIGKLLAQPAKIPTIGELSMPPPGGTYQVNLNPDGFPQENGILPTNWNCDLATKPSCQLEASYKISQGFLSTAPSQMQPFMSFWPYKSTHNPHGWLTAHLQAYIYMQYLVNLEIDKVLTNLEMNGSLANTIIIFTSDHGELGGAHGGQIEKWHNAYRETIHVPLMVSSPLVNQEESIMRDLPMVTSHIDLVPTLLGLAGYDKSAQAQLEKLILGHEVYPLVGRDLSPLIYGQNDSETCDTNAGVLFVTDDEITLPTDTSNLPSSFVDYLKIVNAAIAAGQQATTEGSIVQPNSIKAYVEKDWKLALYWDQHGEAQDQWEMYYLKGDPEENINLLNWSEGLPILKPERMNPSWGLSIDDLTAALARLRLCLEESLTRAGYPQGSAESTRLKRNEPTLSQFNYNLP